MKAGGKSARTSLEEKTGAAPSVAKLPIDANGGRGELRALGGGKHDEWNQHLTAQLAGSLPEARGSMTAATVEGSLGALTGQIGIDPQDPVEGMLSAQMIAANAAALDLYRRAWIPEQSFEVSTRYLALADKAARTLARLSEALDRHRGKGQQQITVKHVTVNADQAVIADTVVGGSKGTVEISNDGNNAPLLLEARHAPGLALQARSKRTRKPCQSPAVSGWAVCRMHGARGGAPKGKANGNYKTGEHTAELREARRLVRAILRRTKDAEAVV